MRYVGLKICLAFLLAASPLAAQASAQGGEGRVSKEDAAAARATAADFAERLQATQDFAPVMREMYAADFMSRQLRSATALADVEPRAKTFMLEAIPALTFERALAERGSVEDWTRVYAAASDMMYFVFESFIARTRLEDSDKPDAHDTDPGGSELLEVFPPEAVALLDKNPTLANFLSRKGADVPVRTPEELREMAATLEEVVRLSRPRLAEALAKGAHLGANQRLMREAARRDGVKASRDEAEAWGYPPGMRLYTVFAPNGYVLKLVKSGADFKIVSAAMPHD